MPGVGGEQETGAHLLGVLDNTELADKVQVNQVILDEW